MRSYSHNLLRSATDYMDVPWVRWATIKRTQDNSVAIVWLPWWCPRKFHVAAYIRKYVPVGTEVYFFVTKVFGRNPDFI